MPFEMQTKKVLDESQKAKDTAKAADVSKKPKVMAEGAAAQEESLKPKDDKKPDAAKKDSPDAKAAKKESAKKSPPEPEKIAKDAQKKDDGAKDYWATREVVAASHNAAKLDEAKLKTWIKTAEGLLEKADFSMAVDLRNAIERFQEAIEALKQPKGLAPGVINGFLKSVEGASKMKDDEKKRLTTEGEKLLKAATKTQAEQVQTGLDKLYKMSGTQE